MLHWRANLDARNALNRTAYYNDEFISLAPKRNRQDFEGYIGISEKKWDRAWKFSRNHNVMPNLPEIIGYEDFSLFRTCRKGFIVTYAELLFSFDGRKLYMIPFADIESVTSSGNNIIVSYFNAPNMECPLPNSKYINYFVEILRAGQVLHHK